MESIKEPLTRRQWRKELKKQQRKRKRQLQAKERDKQKNLELIEKMKNPVYVELLRKQEQLENSKEQAEYLKRCDEEEAWLRRELIAQLEFKRNQKNDLLNNNINCDKNKERKHEEKHKELVKDASHREFELLMDLMDEYMGDVRMATPPQFRMYVESRPGNQPCEFFDKTNCCRFGYTCRFNHKRPILSKCILIKNFFQHALLTMRIQDHNDDDDYLELDEDDLQKSYEEFCKDVWPELEKFGYIVTFRVTRNIQKHLSGHAFVEYKHKRESLKAFINLQGRFYACKRLNVEFSNIKNWRTAVCGTSAKCILGIFLNRHCPKGSQCNYLHLFKNPRHKYEKPLDYAIKMKSTAPTLSHESSWSTIENETDSTERKIKWRWSESPEMDITKDAQCNSVGAATKPPTKITQEVKVTKRKHSKEISKDIKRSKRKSKSKSDDSSKKDKRNKIKRSPRRSKGKHNEKNIKATYNSI